MRRCGNGWRASQLKCGNAPLRMRIGIGTNLERKVTSFVIASIAKQSKIIAKLQLLLDCFVASLLAMTVMLVHMMRIGIHYLCVGFFDYIPL